MLMQWYRRRFSDPEDIALLWSFWWLVLASSFFFSGLLAPLLVTYRTGLPGCDEHATGDWLFPALGGLHCPYPLCRHSVINGVLW